ncbi:MAG: nucleoside kinase [Candidatus Euphemobacter frigidus]|nr:nucleoside kinase [Candidatus Euphemobacter frigidus]MDP8276721.1 nucleoside kinase [Candidatus Euphemobacter frigidus]
MNEKKKTFARPPKKLTARKSPKRKKKEVVMPPLPGPEQLEWEKIYEMEIVTRARAWNRARDMGTIEGINRRMAFGGYRDVIRDADRAYEGSIWKIAGEIMERRDTIRLVIVAGPSSSGKTTTTLKLCEALRAMGEDPQLLSLDNYFWNLKDQPQDEFGDYQFESPQALDIETINQNLRDLLAGKETTVPVYDFMAGGRKEKWEKMKLLDGQLLVMEGLHAFYQPMTAGIPGEIQFRVYIETVCQLQDGADNFIPWTDIRLLRRMVRDNLQRNYTPVRTLGHWHYVRQAEKEFIVPFIGQAEAVINGYLPYELPVYKKYLYESLKAAVEEYAGQTGKEDARRRGARCLNYLEEIDVLEDDSVISPSSLIREFIGGSIY